MRFASFFAINTAVVLGALIRSREWVILGALILVLVCIVMSVLVLSALAGDDVRRRFNFHGPYDFPE
jgi:hypothetical protein